MQSKFNNDKKQKGLDKQIIIFYDDFLQAL